MFKSEHQRTGGQLYISINLPSSLPTPTSPHHLHNGMNKSKKKCPQIFSIAENCSSKKEKADLRHFDICFTKLMWTKNIFSQKKVPMNISKYKMEFVLQRNYKNWKSCIAGWQDGTIGHFPSLNVVRSRT